MLPPLLMIGFGMGGVMAPAMNMATYGVVAHDAGVASAMVNTMQQVGGSIGTSLFNTLAASTTTDYLVGRDARDPVVRGRAALQGYDTAYLWAAGFLAAGLVVSVLLYRSGAPAPTSAREPVRARAESGKDEAYEV